ncbi:MAG: hypothetical protein PHC75_03285 [Burkholderiales bacterium]|nr:hypothetical protein [Burkholderiales bacterium]
MNQLILIISNCFKGFAHGFIKYLPFILIASILLCYPIGWYLLLNSTLSHILMFPIIVVVSSPVFVFCYELFILVICSTKLLKQDNSARKFVYFISSNKAIKLIIKALYLILFYVLIQSVVLFAYLGGWYLINNFKWISLIQFIYILFASLSFAFFNFMIIVLFTSATKVLDSYSVIKIKEQIPIALSELKLLVSYVIRFDLLRTIFLKFKLSVVVLFLAGIMVVLGYQDYYKTIFSKIYVFIVLAHLMGFVVSLFVLNYLPKSLYKEFGNYFDVFFKIVEFYITMLNIILMVLVSIYFSTIVIDFCYKLGAINVNVNNLCDMALLLLVSFLMFNAPRMMRDIKVNKIKIRKKSIAKTL